MIGPLCARSVQSDDSGLCSGDATRSIRHGPLRTQGYRIRTTTRATLALVREAGTWQLAGIHLSFIAGTPGAQRRLGHERGSRTLAALSTR